MPVDDEVSEAVLEAVVGEEPVVPLEVDPVAVEEDEVEMEEVEVEELEVVGDEVELVWKFEKVVLTICPSVEAAASVKSSTSALLQQELGSLLLVLQQYVFRSMLHWKT